MIDEVKSKIIAALEQADIHFKEEWDQAEDAPREFDPLDYLNDFHATAIGVTGDYSDELDSSMSSFTVLLDDRFLADFQLNLPQYCDDESDARLGMTITDLGEDPDAALQAARTAFSEEVSRIAADAVWRVFHCTAVQNLDKPEALAFYENLARKMHAGIDQKIQELKNS
ncbi:MAG: hypothetical protein ACYCSH_01300 [Acidithiobacillus sp.]